MNYLQQRLDLSLTQTEFWKRVGISQSGGSRYETGRVVSAPVRKLLAIAYGTPAQRATALKSLTNWKKKTWPL